MADNTSSYAANIAVRAFLTKFTEDHLGEVFGHRLSDGEYKSGKKKGVRKYGEKEWKKIKKNFTIKLKEERAQNESLSYSKEWKQKQKTQKLSFQLRVRHHKS